jgi:hypothetical protein
MKLQYLLKVWNIVAAQIGKRRNLSDTPMLRLLFVRDFNEPNLPFGVNTSGRACRLFEL